MDEDQHYNDPQDGSNAPEGIGGFHDAQHNPQSRQNECDNCE
jgi:hypothetical protein